MNRWFPVLLLVLLLVLLGGARGAQAQRAYVVDNFSPTYFGKIYIADTSEVFSPGWVAIYSKKTKQQVLKVASEELALGLHEGKALANIKRVPYGEQSLIISEDFNFDGRKDLAIADGQNSCYHGPSFQIYLATATGFAHSPALTALAQDNCGMFQVDARARRLHTMTKSGCCWHAFSEFVVQKNGKPFEVKRLEDDLAHFPLRTQTEATWNGNRMVTKVTRLVDLTDNDAKVLCAFRLAENGKRVVLFTTEETLYYALLRKDQSLEFLFPALEGDGSRQFWLEGAGGASTLWFANDYAAYTVQQAANGKVTMSVKAWPDAPRRTDPLFNGNMKAGDKMRNFTSQPASRTGSLRSLRSLKLHNLHPGPPGPRP